MEDDLVELGGGEETVSSHRRIARARSLQRPLTEIAREDDVNDVLGGEAPLRGDRVDDRDRPLDRKLFLDPDLLQQFAVERVDEALTGVDPAAGQQPVLLAALLVAAEQDATLAAEDRRHADPRLDAHYTREEPKPRSPRSVSASSSCSSSVISGTGRTTSCAIRMPGSTTNVSPASVLWKTTRTSPR